MTKLRINYAYTSNIGRVRKNNEDNFQCCGQMMDAVNEGLDHVVRDRKRQTDLPVLAVFDGMGGESCGEHAAYLAAASLGEVRKRADTELENDPDAFLRKACREMNRAVCAYSAENKISVMGTTAAVLSFGPKGIWTCNLGDSRIYRLHEGELTRMSQDHVFGGGLFGKSPLMQFLGVPEEEMILEPAFGAAKAVAGDKYLLCTDGVTDMLSDAEIAEGMKKEEEPEIIVGRLLDAALEKGGRDNTTLIVCEVAEDGNGVFEQFFGRFKNKIGGDDR